MYVISRLRISCGSKLLFYRPNCSCFCKGQMLDWLQWKKQLDKNGNWQQVYLRSGAAIALCFYIPIPNVYVFQKKRFYSVIQSYYTITDSLQNCKKSILVCQVLISLSLNVCTVKKVHAESQYYPLPLGLFTGNTNHIYFGNVILCAYPSSLTHLMYVDQLR